MTETSAWSLMPTKRCFPQNASIQTAKKLCTVWAIQCFSNYIGAQKVIRDLSPASHLPQQPTHQGWRGDQRTHSYLANNTPRTECRGKICPKLQILTWKWACGLPKLFNGYVIHLSRTERTATTSTDKITGTLRRMCVKECPQHMSMAAPIIATAIYKLERVWSGSTMTLAQRNNST